MLNRVLDEVNTDLLRNDRIWCHNRQTKARCNESAFRKSVNDEESISRRKCTINAKRAQFSSDSNAASMKDCRTLLKAKIEAKLFM